MICHGKRPYLECSSRGDRRFSALFASVNGRCIEQTYQEAKVFSEGAAHNMWLARGRQAVNQDEVRTLYSKLWDQYIAEHPELLDVLCSATGLSDMFGRPGHACQATELWRIREQERIIKEIHQNGTFSPPLFGEEQRS